MLFTMGIAQLYPTIPCCGPSHEAYPIDMPDPAFVSKAFCPNAAIQTAGFSISAATGSEHLYTISAHETYIYVLHLGVRVALMIQAQYLK